MNYIIEKMDECTCEIEDLELQIETLENKRKFFTKEAIEHLISTEEGMRFITVDWLAVRKFYNV